MNAKRKAIEALKQAGYHRERDGGNHEIYCNDSLGTMIPVRHHFTDADLKVILKEIDQYRKGK